MEFSIGKVVKNLGGIFRNKGIIERVSFEI